MQFGTNAFQRFGRIVQCVENNIPVIYSAPEDAWGRMVGEEGHIMQASVFGTRNEIELHNIVEELIRNNQDITPENISYHCTFTIPPCAGD